MKKSLSKNQKEDIILGICAITTGILSFFITLNIYPRLKDEEVVLEKQEYEYSQNEVDSNFIFEEKVETVALTNDETELSINMHDYEIETDDDKVTEVFASDDKLEFVWPISGDIIKKFAIDSLIFSNTLNEWCVHEGVDIAGNLGDDVFSAESGKIDNIYNDSKYGSTVIIEHKDGYKSVYSFVNSELEVGQNVHKGEKIGTLTNCTNYEVNDTTHLHFELLKNEENLSPELEIKY